MSTRRCKRLLRVLESHFSLIRANDSFGIVSSHLREPNREIFYRKSSLISRTFNLAERAGSQGQQTTRNGHSGGVYGSGATSSNSDPSVSAFLKVDNLLEYHR
jgi:hypothetical protein